MPKLKGSALKILKAVHLFAACSWLGGGLALLVLNCAKYAGWIDGGALYGTDLASHIVDRWVIVNLGAFLCLGTGLVYSLFTAWGFFRHRWIAVKWAVIVACIGFGIWLGGQEERLLALSAEMGGQALASPEYWAVQWKYTLGGAAQVCVIVLVLFVSVFRPWKGKKAAHKA